MDYKCIKSENSLYIVFYLFRNITIHEECFINKPWISSSLL